IGAVNAYAIASGLPADQLVARWLDLAPLSRHRLRVPLPPWHGVVEASELEHMVRGICEERKPVLPLGVVATHMASLTPRLFRDEEIGWQTVLASCAVPFVLPQYRLEGGWHGDGGLLGALPIWAAVEMGATHVVAIN